MLRYPVILRRDTNGTVLVDFPDVPEAHTFGENRQEALARAPDALETALMGYIESRLPVPEPRLRSRGLSVKVPSSTELKLSLYSAMRAAGIDKPELARRLSRRPADVNRLLDLRRASPLEDLEGALLALGKRLSVQVSDAA
jgi:antitoxin HicB